MEGGSGDPAFKDGPAALHGSTYGVTPARARNNRAGELTFLPTGMIAGCSGTLRCCPAYVISIVEPTTWAMWTF